MDESLMEKLQITNLRRLYKMESLKMRENSRDEFHAKMHLQTLYMAFYILKLLKKFKNLQPYKFI